MNFDEIHGTNKNNVTNKHARKLIFLKNSFIVQCVVQNKMVTL